MAVKGCSPPHFDYFADLYLGMIAHPLVILLIK